MSHNGVAVKPQMLGDKPHAVTLTVQCHNVHKSLLGDYGHLLGYPRRLPCHPREGGTPFIPIFGTLLHSRRQQGAGRIYARLPWHDPSLTEWRHYFNNETTSLY